MYTSLDWLNQLINVKTIQLEELIDKLTLGGFEVEETLQIDINNQKQTILDISATANRADSLSIKGIAKEITALLNQPTFNSNYNYSDLESQKIIADVTSLAKSNTDYSTFVTVSVENLTNFTIPKWLTEKLVCSKIEPTNTLFDFQTYVLLETGYPFEFYDLKKIQTVLQTSEFDLCLTTAKPNTIFIANNNSEYNLTSDILVVEANNYPLSIGGIISNEQVAYTSETTSLLIEGSIFSSKKIRQQSRILGVRTDRSARYEKGLNNSYFTEALLRLIQLLRITNPNLICKVHTASEVEQVIPPTLILNYENVIEILGPVQIPNTNISGNITPDQITEYLKRLDLKFIFDDEQIKWSVSIPIARMDDLEREIDLIEEIGRLHGFNHFVTNLPTVNNIGQEDFSYQIRKKLTNCFLNEGLNELMHYSLVNDGIDNSIPLINPLIIDCSTLRTSLLHNLVKIVSENVKQGNGILEGFEYGHVFSGDIQSEYIEKEMVGGIFGGIKSKRQWDQTSQTLSWFEGKGKIEELFKKLKFDVSWKPAVVSNNYKTVIHPYRTAGLWLSNGQCLGIFGQIHPVLAKTFNLPVDLFLFEFDLDIIKIEYQTKNLALYQSYSTYPKITKDLSFVIDRKISFKEIEKSIFKNGSDYLKTIDLLDEYRGNSIPENQTSLCIQLTFQSIEKTLVTKEIDEIIKNLQTVLENSYKVTIRI